MKKVYSWLEEILWEKKSSMDLYRCKGILNVHGSDKLHTLQVSDTFSFIRLIKKIYEIKVDGIIRIISF